MSIADEIRRARMKGSAEAINRRHRQAQEQARQLQSSMKAPTPSSGVNPGFAAQLEAKRKEAKAFEEHRDSILTNEQRIAQLQLEGKLPPSVPVPVGYEPTAEEVLGDLVISETVTDPDQLESVPTADEVLNAPRAEDETEPLTHQQLNPGLQGALKQAAFASGARPGNVERNRSKKR